ncbi:hypothetical protein FKM82_027933 [Ascaphus truei]
MFQYSGPNWYFCLAYILHFAWTFEHVDHMICSTGKAGFNLDNLFSNIRAEFGLIPSFKFTRSARITTEESFSSLEPVTGIEVLSF